MCDPDRFFGEGADYMLSVLLDGEAPGSDDEGVWRVLVLEDTGELLAADAKEQTGQGLSRLLNVVDGLVGQGLRVLVLITTNDELKRLHPAVTRAGRCAVDIRFDALDAIDARAWLAERDALPDDSAVASPMTLADLFACARGSAARSPAPVGFA